MSNESVKVMVFGVFDKFHEGHKYFIERARKYGSVIAVIATDKNVKREKGKLPRDNISIRAKNLEKHVSRVIYGDEEDYMKPLLDEMPDVICLGYDQQNNINFVEKYIKINPKVKIVRLDPHEPGKYKSSLV